MQLGQRSLPPPPWRSWRLGGCLSLLTVCISQLFSSDVRAANDRHQGPAASACSEACDKKASDCVDVCELKLKEDKPRIQCKLACIADREKCEKDCP